MDATTNTGEMEDFLLTTTTPPQVTPSAPATVDNDNIKQQQQQQQKQQQQQQDDVIVDRFHQDMRRILRTKRDMFRRIQATGQSATVLRDGNLPKAFSPGERPREHEWMDSYAPFAPWFHWNEKVKVADDSNEKEWHSESEEKEPSSPSSPFSSRLIMTYVERPVQRPPIVSLDFDGAERVHVMLRLLQQRHQATLETYEIVMQAYLMRGRLRWFHDYHENDFDSDDEEEEDENERETYDTNDGIDDENTEIRSNSNANDDLHVLFDSDETDHDTILDDDPREEDRNVDCAADVVHHLWNDWRRQQQQVPNSQTVTWNTATACWMAAQAICATPRGERPYAQRVWSSLQALQTSSKDESVPLEALFHGIHAAAWQQGNLEAPYWAERAQTLYEELVERISCMDEEKDTMVTLLAYPSQPPCSVLELSQQAASWTLEAWSKSGSPGSADRAQTLLNQMMKWNATTSHGDRGYVMDPGLFTNTILSWCKEGGQGAYADRAQTLLEYMIQLCRQQSFGPGNVEPPIIVFNSVLSAWSKQGNADKVLEVWELLKDAQQSFPSLMPGSITYSTLGRCLVRSVYQDRNDPTTTKMDEWETMVLVEECLQELELLWKKGDESYRPNNRLFNMAINAYAKTRNIDGSICAQKSMSLLNRMRHSDLYRPDTVTIASVVECLSKTSSPKVPKMVLSLVKNLIEEYRQTKRPEIMPNVRVIAAAISALSQSYGRPQDARYLLEQLLELYKESDYHPDLKPNAFPYNFVLNCASNVNVSPEEKPEVFRLAAQTYKDMRQLEYVQPDSYTYGFWIKCCNNLLDDVNLRSKCIKFAFQECKDQGLVSSEVIQRLYQKSSWNLIQELLEMETAIPHQSFHRKANMSSQKRAHPPPSLKDLPGSWTRNVKRPTRRRTER